MSWAAVNRELRELLPRFTLPADQHAAHNLLEKAMDIGAEDGVLTRLQHAELKPSAAEAEALRRTVCMAAEQLEGLSSSLQEVIGDDATERVVSTGCVLVGITAHLCVSVSVPESDLRRVLSSVQVILRCGATAQLFSAGQVLCRQLSIGQLCSRLGMQVWALAAWQHLVSRLPDSTNPVDWVKAVAPPALLQQWLHCVVLNMEMSAPASWKPGSELAILCTHLSEVVAPLCLRPAFGAHWRLLVQDEQLCRSLLELLLPGVSAMAVGLQLPPERRSPECNWRNASCLAAIVAETPRRTRDQVLGADVEAARRLLVAAAQLLQHCPFPAPSGAAADGDGTESTLHFVALLAAAAMAQPHRPSPEQASAGPASSAASGPAADFVVIQPRQAQQLLAALPRVGEALTATAQEPSSNGQPFSRLVNAAVHVVALLADAARPIGSPAHPPAAMAGPADLPAWCRGAAGALRWLPCVTAAVAQRQQDTAAVGADVQLLRQEASQLSYYIATLAVYAICSIQVGLQSGDAAWAACSPAVRAEGLSALWELHTGACRLVHWVLGGGPHTQLLDPSLRRPLVLDAVIFAHRLVQPPSAAAPEVARCMRAMCAAHLEALLAISDSCGDAPPHPNAARDVLEGIVLAVFWESPALVSDVRLQAAVARCLRHIPEGSRLSCFSELQLFDAAVLSPRAAAVLVAEGALDAVGRASLNSPMGREAATLAVTAAAQLVHAAKGEVADHGPLVPVTSPDLAAELAEALAEADRAVSISRDLGPRRHDPATWQPPARRLAAALLAWWRRPEARPAAAQEAAQAAAARSCAYLRCSNLGGEGGPAAGPGAGHKRRSACRAVWYCGTACSYADWRAGHKHVCRALGAARAAQKERRRQAAGGAAEAAAEGQVE